MRVRAKINGMENLNHYVSSYQEQLKKGDIIIAYDALVKFVMQVRTNCIKKFTDRYAFSGMLHGYMDYTYFYYTNEFLKSKKLKLGLVLNHVDMRFEIWLLGNTKTIQQTYWNALKDSVWNKDRGEMPPYSVIEIVVENAPDFNDLTSLALKLENEMITVSDDIIASIKELG